MAKSGEIGGTDLKQAAALVLLGIAIGCAVSHFYFTGFLEDRAEDGLPVAMGGHLFRIEYVQPQGVGEVSAPDMDVSWIYDNVTFK